MPRGKIIMDINDTFTFSTGHDDSSTQGIQLGKYNVHDPHYDRMWHHLTTLNE